MAVAFHGERKTDAADAVVIAQTARVHTGLPKLSNADAAQAQLQLLTARRKEPALAPAGTPGSGHAGATAV
jgi:Transposase